MLTNYYISEKFFTEEELRSFKKEHGINIKDIQYSSATGEIDFSDISEKEYLLKEGHPKILARFFA